MYLGFGSRIIKNPFSPVTFLLTVEILNPSFELWVAEVEVLPVSIPLHKDIREVPLLTPQALDKW